MFYLEIKFYIIDKSNPLFFIFCYTRHQKNFSLSIKSKRPAVLKYIICFI